MKKTIAIIILLIGAFGGWYFFLYSPDEEVIDVFPTDVRTGYVPRPTDMPENKTLGQLVLTDVPTVGDSDTFLVAHKDDFQGTLYQITYNEKHGYVLIMLFDPALALARIEAETELMNATGLSEAVLCGMNVEVKTILRVSSEFHSRNLGLSFCPGSVSLQ